MSKERWNKIKDFDGYEVSNHGHIRSFRRKSYRDDGGRVLKPEISYKGYEQVSLYRDRKQYQKSVHRIVAKSFIPNPNNKRTVNHINGNKTDNRASNLEWMSVSENVTHAYNNGLCESVKEALSRAGANRHPRVKVIETGKIYKSQRELSKELNLCEQCVSRCLRGGSKSSGGYHFEYVEED